MEWFLIHIRRFLIFTMKYLPLLAIVILTLSSCSVYNRIGEFNDISKEIKGITLKQNPLAISTENTDAISGLKQSYKFVSSFRYVQTAGKRPEMFADFQLRAPFSFDQSDSLVYFILDGEKIKLVTFEAGKKDDQKNYATTSGGSKAGKRTTMKVTRENLRFLVPENLWVSIADANEIQYTLFEGKKGLDVILDSAETTRIKQFFRQACALRDAAFPAIPTNPPGLKKW